MTNEQMGRMVVLEEKSRKSFNSPDARKSGPPLNSEEKKELAGLKRQYTIEIKEKYGYKWTQLLQLFEKFDFPELKNCGINIAEEYDVEVEDFLPVLSELRRTNQLNVEAVKVQLYLEWVSMFSRGSVPSEDDECWEKASREIVEFFEKD